MEPTVTVLVFAIHSRLVAVLFCVVVILSTTFVLLVGSVVATPDGIARRWLGVRRFRWDEVDYLHVVERVPWWLFFGPWFVSDVVEVATRDRRRLTLWPTRSSVAGRMGTEGQTPAQVKSNLLQRYREIYAPVDPRQRRS